ncbi:MAG: tetratricopeptide repeat protein [Deltaproteobacteria bacterium]|nr:tetratricopeptide repeat protein [Deltaproteobacteria bacterium]
MASPRAERIKQVWRCLLLLALVAVLYGRTLSFEFAYVDDSRLVIDRARFLSDLSNAPKLFREPYFVPAERRGEGYYRPLVSLTYMLDAQGGPLSPAAYHRTNVALHAAACLLVFALFSLLLANRNAALACAAVFAVHPALTETVVWIPGRNDTIAVIFMILAWIAHLAAPKSQSAARRLLLWAAYAVSFLFALLSKEAAIMLPLLVVGHHWLADRVRPTSRSLAILLAASAAPIIIWATLRAQIGAEGSTESLFQRAGVAVAELPSLLLFLGKAVFPFDLAPLAHQKDSSWLPALAALPVVSIAFYRVNADVARRMAAGFAFFFLALAPTLPVSDTLILENRLYLPMIGLLYAAAVRIQALALSLRAVALLAGPVVALFGALAFRYSDGFRDRHAFAASAVHASPNLALAQMTHGNSLLVHGNIDAAETAYQATLRLDPNRTIAHNNLGVVHLRRNNVPAAEAEFRVELARNPTYAPAHYNLGLALYRTGRGAEAVTAWLRAAELEPDHVDAVGELWAYFSRTGDTARAAEFRSRLERLGLKVVK